MEMVIQDKQPKFIDPEISCTGKELKNKLLKTLASFGQIKNTTILQTWMTGQKGQFIVID